jgi:hypothetical protein
MFRIVRLPIRQARTADSTDTRTATPDRYSALVTLSPLLVETFQRSGEQMVITR